MARARNIKPGFFRNADLVELSFEARLLFIGLWTIADRSGRMEDRPKQIKMELFPADNLDCDALLSQLAEIGMVERYMHDGKRYLHVVNFVKHQNPHRDEKASTMPGPCGFDVPTKKESSGHGANTVQAPCKQDGDTVSLGLNPDPRFLIPETLIPETLNKGALPVQPPDVPDGTARPSIAGAICVAMKASGLASVNPSHPDLQVLIDKGADIGLFVDAAKEAVKKQKPFAYVLAMVKGRMVDAAALAQTALAAPSLQAGTVNKQEALEQRNRRVAEEWAAGETA